MGKKKNQNQRIRSVRPVLQRNGTSFEANEVEVKPYHQQEDPCVTNRKKHKQQESPKRRRISQPPYRKVITSSHAISKLPIQGREGERECVCWNVRIEMIQFWSIVFSSFFFGTVLFKITTD